MYHADIQMLTFSLDAQFLGLISKNQTVHIWDLKAKNGSGQDDNADGNNTNDEAFEATPRPTIDDQELERIQNEEEPTSENLSNTDNSWYSYLSSIANSVYNVTTSYLDATYNLTTGGVINRADYNCKIPVGCSAQSLAITQKDVILNTNENTVLVYSFIVPKNIKMCSPALFEKSKC